MFLQNELLEDMDFSEAEKIETSDFLSNQLSKELPKPLPELQMVVIIPAKNEENHIKSTLQCFIDQINEDGTPFDKVKFEVLVLCHNCSDNTNEEATSFFRNNSEISGHVLSLDSDIANTVGAARRILMNIAFSRIPIDNGLIISTDADTLPDAKWLYYLEDYIHKDIALICGLIISNPNGLNEQALTYLNAKDEYLLLKSKLESQLLPKPHDPWPRHNFNWGPNLTIKKSIYKAVGGIRPLHFLEDVDLYNRVVSEGHFARHCLNSKVLTSTRTNSRCQEGFGAELRIWNEWVGVEYNVEGLLKLLLRFQIYDLIQKYYLNGEKSILSMISKLGCISINDLQRFVRESNRVEALTIKIQEHLNKSDKWNSLYPNKGVLEVLEELKVYFNST